MHASLRVSDDEATNVEPGAESELAEGIAWYEEESPGKGAELETTARARVLKLAEPGAPGVTIPGVGPERPIRRVFLDGFPYAVIYVETADTIYVIAFAHFKRRPGYWRRRAERVLGPKRRGE